MFLFSSYVCLYGFLSVGAFDIDEQKEISKRKQ